MATIRPFRGLRFAGVAGDLSNLVAPPYDVISPQARAALAEQSQYNIVGVTLPESNDGDRSKYIKYLRSAALLEEWRTSGALELDSEPRYCRYSQEFVVPGTDRAVVRTKLLATIKVEPYCNGVVLPHEQTFPKHKEDRMRILEATRSHVECIFGLFEDQDRSLHDLIASSPAATLAQLDSGGVSHKLERFDDPAVCERITEAMASRKVWIADGHHRYETALEFRERLGEQKDLIPEDFMLMALCSISDPGLVILPTHRILKSMQCTADELRAKLAEHFEIQEVPSAKVLCRIGEIAQGGGRALGVLLPGEAGLVATVRDLDRIVEQQSGTGSVKLKRLDVSILHSFVFERLLGLKGHDFFGYTRDEAEALASVRNGAPAAFLMNPPTVDDMRAVAECGDFMPQKSTYYFPKLLSGLVLWSLKDFA